ncbi:MAG: O-acetyl-ADP-ribose deacetylase, partial [Syntrophales bacterium]|nr:O-acetyl-ADP-ribose deacetylase [Syntrophales bacterium]
EGDITEEKTDAVVNAANSRLMPGGGVDGAVHRAGGPAIAAECRLIGGCPTGRAAITTAGNLRAKFVIHAVGPIYRGGAKGEAELLESAYLESLRLAAEKGLESLSFPAISAGVYGYPPDKAAFIALKTTLDFLKEKNSVNLVRFVLFGRPMYDIFTAQLKSLHLE